MMLESMPYEEFKKLSYDERLEFENEELRNDIEIRDHIINQKNNLLNQDKILLDKKDKEIVMLQKLLRKNNIEF